MHNRKSADTETEQKNSLRELTVRCLRKVRHLINFSEGKQKSVIFTARYFMVINIPSALS